METTIIEIACPADANNAYVHDQCIVSGCDIQIDHEKKEITCNVYQSISMAGHTTENQVNYCKFEIPENAYCNYVRTIQAKPPVQERKWFRVENGEMIVLADVKGSLSPSFAVEQFFGEYLKTYKVRHGRTPFKPKPKT